MLFNCTNAISFVAMFSASISTPSVDPPILASPLQPVRARIRSINSSKSRSCSLAINFATAEVYLSGLHKTAFRQQIDRKDLGRDTKITCSGEQSSSDTVAA